MSIEEEEDASLKELVVKTLQTSGVLGKIQAQLRASVFLALEEEFRDKNVPLVSQATQELLATPEGSTAAALVHDFLHTLGLDFSLAVFAPESGHPSTWSLPPTDSLATHLRLTQERKGSRTPLLVELVRERQGGIGEENGDLASLHSNKSCSSNKEDHSASHSNNNSTGNSSQIHKSHSSLSSHSLSQDASQLSSQLSQTAANISKQQERNDTQILPDLAADEIKQDAVNCLNGDKHYEDDFSSMSEKEEREKDDGDYEEDEVTEDIDEDISLDDLINSSNSAASDNTKDQPLSQISNPPDYQEVL
ncbi:hypothetical protein Pmani_015360 [Petrolisthes manimaculis]|uniref:Centrosomal protein 43 n=1 Tax=Petrolisthes manimaculis TaxID=1843537 RepID=A0AAE1U7F9_9EUCA|nr:hypothetical protein Pmani_015360 [Petrolisthes manimaculis]